MVCLVVFLFSLIDLSHTEIFCQDITAAHPLPCLHIRWCALWHRGGPDIAGPYGLCDGRLWPVLCQRHSRDRRPSIYRRCYLSVVQYVDVQRPR